MEISFIVPFYNEHPSVVYDTLNELEAVLRTIDNIKYEIIAVNDGSTKYSYPELKDRSAKLLVHSNNIGYGASILTGIESSRYNWIAITDADGTYPAESFVDLIEFVSSHDMVVGKREWNDIPLIRRPAKYILQMVASFLVNQKIPDLNSGMRIFKKEIVKSRIRLFPNGFSLSSTLTMICLTSRYTVKFVKIAYHERTGFSSIKPVRDTIGFFTLIFRLAMYFNPLRFFVPLSMIVGVLAVLRGLRDVIAVNSIGGLSLVLFFMSFQIFFFGLIADIINKK